MNMRDGFNGFDVARSIEDFNCVKRIMVKWGGGLHISLLPAARKRKKVVKKERGELPLKCIRHRCHVIRLSVAAAASYIVSPLLLCGQALAARSSSFLQAPGEGLNAVLRETYPLHMQLKLHNQISLWPKLGVLKKKIQKVVEPNQTEPRLITLVHGSVTVTVIERQKPRFGSVMVFHNNSWQLMEPNHKIRFA